ncbi:type II toxin-antitoxin system VapC family toxin [Lonepinella koalarum]|uniref:type II toxin-antitoxin system VapC family toxin n=1 Tax=Lonepinella koalarum TaxID=53417 RepID=UPI003F6DFA1A
MANYLLDTNYLIHLSKNDDNPNKREILQEIKQILLDDNSRLVITPLISYEVLRGIGWKDDETLYKIQGLLDSLEMLDIKIDVADLARDLYRFDVYQSAKNNIARNFEKRKFDIFHFATAKLNGLQMLSKDNDMLNIEKLYLEMNS